MGVRIFISHASQDEALVRAFVRALDSSIAIPDEQIRCTSLPGYQLPPGVHTSTVLRDELFGAEIVIGILTPASLRSGWVLFELGASWGKSTWTVPVLAGVKPSQLPGPLVEHNAADARIRHSLETFFRSIANTLHLETKAPGKADDALMDVVLQAQAVGEHALPFDVARLGVRILHPTQTPDGNPPKVAKVDVLGSFEHLPPEQYSLRPLRGYPDSGGFLPHGKLIIDKTQKKWRVSGFDVGGQPGDNRAIEIAVVGPEAQALLDCWNRAHSVHSEAMKELRALNSSFNQWLPPIPVRPSDLVVCASVDVKRAPDPKP